MAGKKSLEAVARHGNLGAPGGGMRSVLKWIGLGAVVALVSSFGIAGIASAQLASNINDNVIVDHDLSKTKIPAISAKKGAINMLVVGSDTRHGQGGGFNKSKVNTDNADVILLLHINSNHKTAQVVSFPRDLVVPVPSCAKNDGSGGRYSAMSAAQINSTKQYGGVPCTVKTVEKLTGLHIPFYAEIGFRGVIEMTNAVGGVNVCLTGAVNDKGSGLKLAAGTHTLKGKKALAFLRDRHGIGDGSDLGRISGQQVYMSSLVRKMTAQSTLSNPTELYGLAAAAAENINLSSTLSSVDNMVSLAKAGANIKPADISFIQAPTGADPANPNRVVLSQPTADKVFRMLKDDKPFKVSKNALGRGSVKANKDDYSKASASPSAKASADASASSSEDVTTLPDSVSGQTGAQETCAKSRSSE